MSLQEILVIVIVFFCVSYVGVHFYRFFQHTGSGKNPCEGCTSDCSLRDQIEKERQECTRNKQKTKKNCCG